MSDFQVSISGISVPKTAVEITYGVDSIPSAVVSIDPTRAKEFISGLEQKKRSPVTVSISSAAGNIQFDGLLDGASLSQSPGGMGCEVYVKSKFQRLKEMYPRIPGVCPNSVDILRRTETLKIDLEKGVLDKLTLGGIDLPLTLPLAQFVKRLLEAVLDLQQDPTKSVKSDYIDLTQFSKVLGGNYKQAINDAKQLISSLDTTAVDGCIVKANQVAQGLIKHYLYGPDTLWDALLACLRTIYCSLVIANDKAYIVPSNSFIKGKHNVPGFRAKGDGPNIATPAMYNNFTFDNSSYKDIGKCWLIVDSLTTGVMNANIYDTIGFFEDPQAKSSGLYIDALPAFFILPAYEGVIGKGSQKKTSNKETNLDKKVDLEEAQKKLQQEHSETNKKMQDAKERYGNNLAEIAYYREKFTDRTGSFMMAFNPNWVPGTTGTLYTRFPGMFLDFYVTNVTHRIALNAPDSGSAVTCVSFCSGRTGAGDDVPGVDQDRFFNYTQGKMTQVQTGFVSNIGG